MQETEDFVQLSIREFERLKKLSDDAVAQVSEAQFFHRSKASDNSLAQIYKHVSGNIRSRWTDFLTSDGEKPDRRRDEEFVIAEADTHRRLLAQWDEAWAVLFATLSRLEAGDLPRTVRIRGEKLTALQAITRQLTHYAYHVGQIVYLAKHLAGEEWKSLSIPLGSSNAFNASPRSYLSDEA